MTEFRQDMPPPGGYAPITYARVPLKKAFFNAKMKCAVFLGVMGLGWVAYHYKKEIHLRERIENRCARLALRPMLEAESDRQVLKQLRKNREWEEKIMKDVKGWEVGKWRHSQIYTSLGPDDYFEPSQFEYYAHFPKDTLARNINWIELH